MTTTSSEKEVSHERIRLNVKKTYKLFIGGAFPRTESGRHYHLKSGENICLGSRKDLREAVVAARNAQKSWSQRSAFNRGQILYRIAEILEARTEELVNEIVRSEVSPQDARKEVAVSIDRLVYYAGWSDKYQAVLSSVNPVSSSHFNFSLMEPLGVVGLIPDENSCLASFVSCFASAVVAGNTVVIISSESKPLASASFGEVLVSSDVPAGVINILTGKRSELIPALSSHMDVNGIVCCDLNPTDQKAIETAAVENLKRVIKRRNINWLADSTTKNSTKRDHAEHLEWIQQTVETKTTWHPVGT